MGVQQSSGCLDRDEIGENVSLLPDREQTDLCREVLIPISWEDLRMRIYLCVLGSRIPNVTRPSRDITVYRPQSQNYAACLPTTSTI